jgi:hypothetical protein
VVEKIRVKRVKGKKAKWENQYEARLFLTFSPFRLFAFSPYRRTAVNHAFICRQRSGIHRGPGV